MQKNKPEIAVLCWEEGLVPRGLVQLETLKGNSTNPETFDFPVLFHRIKGASVETVLENPNQMILERMIDDSRRLIAGGIRAITTSCGFNAIFQKKLTEALDVPVFTSSLLQVPFAHQLISHKKKVGIITAKKAALRKEHLTLAGITGSMKNEILGMETCAEWNKIFITPNDDIDLKIVAQEVVQTAVSGLKQHPNIGAFVLECTDLPPFAKEIRNKTGLPVYDFTTMVQLVASSVGIA